LKKISKEQKGFAFIITILCLALMSILGFAIIGVTTSNFKMAKVDSRSQSSYYIAEAGANYMVDKINTEVEKNGSKYKTNQNSFKILKIILQKIYILLIVLKKIMESNQRLLLL
jgi:type II secretory pathway component PulK